MVDPDDVRKLASRMAVPPRELEQALAGLPEHGFLYHVKGQREIVIKPPLPASVLKATRRHVVIP
jgi:DNA-binding transcriptional regulator YhcF (GntR family)